MSSLPLDGGPTPGSRSHVIPQNRWEEVKAKVKRLYMDQGMTLEQVMVEMKQDGFIATYNTPSGASLHRNASRFTIALTCTVQNSTKHNSNIGVCVNIEDPIVSNSVVGESQTETMGHLAQLQTWILSPPNCNSKC